MNEVLVFLTLLIEMVMVLVCIHIVFKRKVQFDKMTIGTLGVTCITYLFINRGLLAQAYSIVIYVLIGIYCYLEFKHTARKTVIGYVVSLTVAGGIEALVACMAIPIRNEFSLRVIALVASIISLCIALVLLFFVLYPKKKAKLNKYALLGNIVYGLVLGVLIIDYYKNQGSVSIKVLIILGFMLLIYVYMYNLQKSNNEIEKKNLALEMQKIYGGAYEELLTEVRTRQHDFKNQLGAIYSMHLVARSYEELVAMQKEYGDKLLDKCKYDSILTCCNNTILAGYIYYKCIDIVKQGIQIEYKVQLDKVECSFSLHEIIEILGIFMENATENLLIHKDLPRIINLVFLENDEGISLSIANPTQQLTDEDVEVLFKQGYSTKGKKHGIGLARAKELVNEHGALINVLRSVIEGNDWINFTVQIMKRVDSV